MLAFEVKAGPTTHLTVPTPNGIKLSGRRGHWGQHIRDYQLVQSQFALVGLLVVVHRPQLKAGETVFLQQAPHPLGQDHPIRIGQRDVLAPHQTLIDDQITPFPATYSRPHIS